MSLESDLKTACQDALNEGVTPDQIIDRMVADVVVEHIGVSPLAIRKLAEQTYTAVTGKVAPTFLSEGA